MSPTASHSRYSEYRITPAQLREAIDALGQAAKTRRSTYQSKAKNKATHRMIAKSYEHTARAFAAVARILERDQTVLQPLAPPPARTTVSAIKPTCAHCGSENVSVDAAARWSMDIQDWKISDVFDKAICCDDCENMDIELTWVKVQAGRGRSKGRT